MQINIENTKKYLPYIVIAVLFILLLTRSASPESKAEKHDLKAKYFVSQHDTLKKQDSVLKLKYDSLNKVKSTIKIKYNERIKVIDKYSVSDMQQYFDERTKEGGDTR